MYLSFPNSQGKKQKETPLSSGKKKPRTIDLTKSEELGASVREKIERELKFDTEKDLRTNATRLYYASTHKETLNVHVGMMPYLAEVSLNTDGESCSTELQSITTYYHHNSLVKSQTTSTKTQCKQI